ncbi:PIN domain-containing protein [Vasconcelosia minhoensis]|nr:PIN domain-containing protein [Romeria gracilis]
MEQVRKITLPMSEPLLLDTDVIIDYLRGQTDAVAYLEGLTNPLLISAVTVAELYVGVREGEEREALDIL